MGGLMAPRLADLPPPSGGTEGGKGGGRAGFAEWKDRRLTESRAFLPRWGGLRGGGAAGEHGLLGWADRRLTDSRISESPIRESPNPFILVILLYTQGRCSANFPGHT